MKKYPLWALVLGMLSLSVVVPLVNAVPLNSNLNAGDQRDHQLIYEIPTDLSDFKPKVLSFYAENPLTVQILNRTEYGNYLQGTPYLAIKTWANVTEFSETYGSDVNVTLDIPATAVYDQFGKVIRYEVIFYAVISNSVSESSSYYLDLSAADSNEFTDFLGEFFGHLVVVTFFLIGGILLYQWAKTRKQEGDQTTSKLYQKIGIGFLLGGVGASTWRILRWVEVLYPPARWDSNWIVENMPFSWMANNYISFITFLALGFAILFISWTAEMDVQRREQPRITYFLLIMQGVVVISMFYVPLFGVIFWVWLAAILLAAGNLLFIFLTLARNSKGELRKKALMISLGVLGIYVTILLTNFLPYSYIYNSLCIVSQVITYWGISKVQIK